MFGLTTRRQRENERLDVHVPFETARLYREAWGEDAPFTDTLPDWRSDEIDLRAVYTLIDDGTLDTIVECNDCGYRERFTFDGEDGEYEAFVDACYRVIDEEHDCLLRLLEGDDIKHNSIDYKLRPCGHYRINDDDRPCGICNVVPLSDDDIENGGELMRVLDDYFADFDEVIIDRMQHSDGSGGYMDKDGNWVRLSAGGIAGR